MVSSSVIVLLPAPKRRLSHGNPPVKLALQRTELPRAAPELLSSSQTSDEELESDEASISDYENSSESDASEQNELPIPSSSTTKSSAKSSRSATLERKTSLKPKLKPYACIHSGCNKSYRKPSRLQEHERSHTGERPFVCLTCDKSYLRESHLRAHSRSHLPASAKPFVCTHQVFIPPKCQADDLVSTQRDSNDELEASTSTTKICNQRFWTAQHLRVHEKGIHLGEKQYKCTSCPAAFTKHGALRTHTAENHSPPGTKPYQCDHPGCKQSFATNQKLKTHARVHDSTRYACAHLECSGTVVQFSTWTALQGHMRSAHPPKCPHKSCQGRTFASSRGLKSHLKTHIDREFEEEQTEITLESWNEGIGQKRARVDLDQSAEFNEPASKRRRGGEVGRDWPCPKNDCDKAFKSKKAQQDHVRVSHDGSRKFPCTVSDCALSFGYKHVMQRHVERHHSNRQDEPSTASTPESSYALGQTISLLTGQDYLRVSTKSKLQRVIACPWPDAFGAEDVPQAAGPASVGSRCAFMFSRAYDLRRHLRSAHGLEVEAEDVNSWVVERKRSFRV
ncbi:hypothetical protein BDV93DRAFT_525337 [Ceratobasidium sp. AG-I]|nr:hypothetical protein BDV93DRAFT_525337 [Ceratobasidium sp. AG-I]